MGNNMGNPTGFAEHMNDNAVSSVSKADSGEFDHGAASNSASASVRSGSASNGAPVRSNRSGIVKMPRKLSGLGRDSGGRAIHPTRASGGLSRDV